MTQNNNFKQIKALVKFDEFDKNMVRNYYKPKKPTFNQIKETKPKEEPSHVILSETSKIKQNNSVEFDLSFDGNLSVDSNFSSSIRKDNNSSIFFGPTRYHKRTCEFKAYNVVLTKHLKIQKKIRELRLKKEAAKRFRLDKNSKSKVEELWKIKNKNTEIAHKYNVRIKAYDFATLRLGAWVNDEIINFYIQIVSENKPNNVHIFNTHFYTILSTKGYDRVKKWTKKVGDVFQLDRIIIPINLNNSHWACAVIKLKDQKLVYYDSLLPGLGRSKTILTVLRDYLQKESTSKRNKDITDELNSYEMHAPVDIPYQTNGYDCGVFTMAFIYYLCHDIPFDFTQEHLGYFRYKFAKEIANI